MSHWNNLPQLRLGVYPTPFYRLENISRIYNKSIWIKRDDLCGVALGGNKVRKLEYLLADAQKQGCDVFFAPVSIEAAAQIIAKAATQNIGMPMLASDTWDSNVVLSAAKGTDLSISVTTFYQEGANADFDKNIKEWIRNDSTALANNGGNDELAAVTVMGYDAYYVALEALKAAGSTSPADVLKALPSVTYTGITGNIAFNDIGDADRDSAVIKKCDTTNGVWEFVTVAKAQ